MWIRVCLLLVFVQSAVGLMCYFCSDSSKADGHNQCQTWHRTMKYYRTKFEIHKTYSTEKYVKNCTAYGDPNEPKYCMIASVEERNNVRSYIRDCSDGKAFFSSAIDGQFSSDFVLPDNQTTCRYTGQGYIACLTMCGSGNFGFGDFCNGPVTVSSVSSILRFSSFLLLVSFSFPSFIFMQL